MKNTTTDYDMGYRGRWQNKDCKKLKRKDRKRPDEIERSSPMVRCAIDKYIYPCKKLPCPPGKIGQGQEDIKRQDYYRIILSNYCTKSPTGCSEVDEDGFVKEIDPICFELNECPVKYGITKIPKEAMKAFEFYKQVLNFGLSEKAREIIRERSRKNQRNKEKAKKAKKILKKMKQDFIDTYKTEVVENNDNSEYSGGGNNNSEFGNNDDDKDNANLDKCNKYKKWSTAYSKFNYILILEKAKNISGTGAIGNYGKQTKIILNQKIEKIKNCLRDLTIKNKDGIQFFKDYAKQEKIIREASGTSKIWKSMKGATTDKVRILEAQQTARTTAMKQTAKKDMKYLKKKLSLKRKKKTKKKNTNSNNDSNENNN